MTDDVAFPWMTAETGATYLDFTGKDRVDAFRLWAKRAGVPTARRGRRVLYHRADLLRAIGAAHLHAVRKVG